MPQIPGGQAGGGTGSISWMDLFLGINVGKYGIPGMGNPYLGIPTFTEALEQDLMSQRPPPSMYLPLAMRPGMSPGGGGPGQSLTSTATPPSIEEVGKIVTQPRAGQQRIGGKRRCPYNFTGGKWHIGGWYKKDRQCVKLAGHGGRHRKPSWMR